MRVSENIVHTAVERGCDLIVMGPGDDAEHVVRDAPCAVLVGAW